MLRAKRRATEPDTGAHLWNAGMVVWEQPNILPAAQVRLWIHSMGIREPTERINTSTATGGR